MTLQESAIWTSVELLLLLLNYVVDFKGGVIYAKCAWLHKLNV